MLSFVQDNYEWIFSGIGVFIISAIFLFVTKKNGNSETHRDSHAEKHIGPENKIEPNYEIDAREAWAEISNSPPYHEEDIIKNFIGQTVSWETHLYSIATRNKDKLSIMSLYKGNYPWVYFEVNIDEYPFFKVAKRNHPFQVLGEITQIGNGGFTVLPFDIRAIA